MEGTCNKLFKRNRTRESKGETNEDKSTRNAQTYTIANENLIGATKLLHLFNIERLTSNMETSAKI